MDAITIGPLVLSSDRLWVALAFVVFIVVAEILDRINKLELSTWAWNTTLIVIIGARLGFVLVHFDVYIREPLTVVYLWQGGFLPLWGVGLGLFYSAWQFRKTRSVMRWAALPAALGLGVWLLPFALSLSQTEEVVRLPQLELEQLSGGSLNLHDFTGQPVVLNLWATWCPPCRKELPLLLETADANPDVAFVFINQAESTETIQTYLAERALDMTFALVDPRSRASEVFRAKGMPTTLFFDTKGELSDAHLGEVSRAALQNYLTALQP